MKKIWAWLKSHTDHLIAGALAALPVSVLVNVLTTVVTHHLSYILHLLHVPAPIIHWMGY